MSAGEGPARVAGRKGSGATILDMVRSIGLLALVVAVTLLFVPGLLHPSHSERFPAVSYADELAGFAQVTHKPALAPTSLPDGWTANAARLTGPARIEHLHIGFAVPGAEYAGLEESVAPPAAAVRSILGKGSATVDARTTLGGRTWERRTSARGEMALTTTTDGVTVIVTGSATPQQLDLLAASLPHVT